MRVINAGKRNRFVSQKGMVLIAVLIFMAAILPVTVLILDSVRIESLMPINENYTEIADKQADLGFYEAIALLMEDQHLVGIDPSREIPDNYEDPLIKAQDYIFWASDDNTAFEYAVIAGTHDLDYLAEPWARHPDNDTFYLVERSLENYDHPMNLNFGIDPELSSVPARWQFQNVPIGMDDFGELIEDPYDQGDEPGMMPVYENYMTGPDDRTPVGQDRLAPHSITQYDPSSTDDSFDWPIVSYMDATGAFAPGAEINWQISPAEAAFVWPAQRPRPASFFRNSPPSGVDGYSPENLVYDSMYDGDNATNQYLPVAQLQEAVTKSTWANTFFGNPYTNNKEYKPAPGSIYPAPIGSEGDVLPAWHETIISDESGRFPINLLMNIVFSSHNLDYYDDGDTEAPVAERDDFDDLNYDDLINDDDHPNHYGYMLARDMVISLMMTDEDMRSDPTTAYNNYEDKAEWILRQMLYKRFMVDIRTDYNADGTPDETLGENDYLGALTPLDGNGRRGDGADMWDGTWNIYNDPKSILSDYAQDSLPAGARPTIPEFERLNQRVTVYSFDTECIADFQENAPGELVRMNINRIQLDDNTSTADLDESRGYDILRSLIGRERARSIVYWRDGLVDLNGDGDLDDEFVEQPLKEPVDDEPISTLTYRERNHPNFQDPTLLTPAFNSNHILFDPDYLNIPSLGSLLTIPMSVQTDQILFSDFTGSNSYDIRLHLGAGGPGSVILGGSDYLYPNLDPFGITFMVEESDDIDHRNTNDGAAINAQVVTDAMHPSFDRNGQRFCYIDDSPTRDIYLSNLDGSTTSNVTNGLVHIPNDLDIGALFGYSIPPLEIAGPDWSPYTDPVRSEWIVFSGGLDINNPGGFLTTEHDLYLINSNGTGLMPLTAAPAGVHYITPVFGPSGYIICTRIDFSGGPPSPLTFWEDLRDMISLYVIPIGVGAPAGRLDMTYPGRTERVVMPLLPTISPDFSQVAFCAFDEGLCNLVPSLTPGIDIFYAPLTLPPATTENATRLWDSGNINDDDKGVAWSPDWGNGPILPANQQDTHSGTRRGRALVMSGYDPSTERELLAAELESASVALRTSLQNGMFQQFYFYNYPAVSSLQVDAMKQIYDKFSVRDSRVYNPDENPGDPFDNYLVQAYGPKININTASRPVLRSILLTMFQGPVWDNWNNFIAGPAPRADDPFGGGIRPVNIAQPLGEVGVDERVAAIQIADVYAHQIVEYRKWVYNNRGEAGVTEETVPDKLSLLVGAGADRRYNFRANPYYPIDLDNNPNTIDKPFFDPAPPFRSVADLFRVMLYPYEPGAGGVGEPWRVEGIESSDGPDEADLPGMIDVTNGNPVAGPNALDIWGPIYIEAGELTVTHGGEIDNLGGGVALPGFDNHGSIQAGPPGNLFVHSRFRLFSADDFKRVEQFLTTRTYVYRVESRGVLRIASGSNRMDITRDKYWIVSVNRDAFAGWDEDGNPGDIDGLTNDYYSLYHADPGKWYSILAYEEAAQGGFKLNRNNFVPW